jgi:hypothetical protein
LCLTNRAALAGVLLLAGGCGEPVKDVRVKDIDKRDTSTSADLTGPNVNNSVLDVTTKGTNRNLTIKAPDGAKVNTSIEARGSKIEGSKINVNTGVDIIQATGGSKINTGVATNNTTIKDSEINVSTKTAPRRDPLDSGNSEINTGVIANNATIKGAKVNANTTITVRTDVDTVKAEGKPKANTELMDELRELDQALKSLGTGTLAFNTPGKMALDETTLVHLVLSTTPQDSELAKQVRGPGQVVTAAAKFAPFVEARLVSDSFGITPVTAARQPVSTVEPTEWRWQVSAKQLGVRNLYLSVYAVITLNGEKHERLLQTFERKLEVQVSFSKCPKNVQTLLE